jgi:predicted Zn-dependent protease
MGAQRRFRVWGAGLLAAGLVVAFSLRSPAVDGGIPSRPHPLPPTLEQWGDPTAGDYFDEIEVPPFGYLIWSRWPVRVYVERREDDPSQNWRETVLAAVMEWDAYVSLEITGDRDRADIRIFRRRPPLKPGHLRARSGETRYRLLTRTTETGSRLLTHQFTILLSPTQTGPYVASVARHEFGHALGIWGHSPEETDVMYFAQVREPPPISPRDVNTLRRIYQQPTQLGWPLASADGPPSESGSALGDATSMNFDRRRTPKVYKIDR